MPLSVGPIDESFSGRSWDAIREADLTSWVTELERLCQGLPDGQRTAMTPAAEGSIGTDADIPNITLQERRLEQFLAFVALNTGGTACDQHREFLSSFFASLSHQTGMSGADLRSICHEAGMVALRQDQAAKKVRR